MKYKIGVYGSAADTSQHTEEVAKELGQELGKHSTDCIVITGAGHGIPYIVASQAAAMGTEIWGYPPVENEQALKEYMPHADLSIYKEITYIPKTFLLNESIGASRAYRNFISTKNCDAGIIIAGRWGTMNEFTKIILSNSPKEFVEKIIQALAIIKQ